MAISKGEEERGETEETMNKLKEGKVPGIDAMAKMLKCGGVVEESRQWINNLE